MRKVQLARTFPQLAPREPQGQPVHLERKGLLAHPVLLGPGPEEPWFQRTRLWRQRRPELVLPEPQVPV